MTPRVKSNESPCRFFLHFFFFLNLKLEKHKMAVSSKRLSSFKLSELYGSFLFTQNYRLVEVCVYVNYLIESLWGIPKQIKRILFDVYVQKCRCI